MLIYGNWNLKINNSPTVSAEASPVLSHHARTAATTGPHTASLTRGEQPPYRTHRHSFPDCKGTVSILTVLTWILHFRSHKFRMHPRDGATSYPL